MAILSNLLVNGTSRLLGKLYCSDLDVSADLTIGGKLSIPYTGIYIAGKKAIWSDSATDTWLRINGTNFSSGVYFGSSKLRTDGELQVGNNGTYFKSNSTATTIANLVATTGTITTLKTGTGNFTNVNVSNVLRANRFDLQSVANLGGSFLISPTLKVSSSATLQVEKSGGTLKLTISDSSITSATLAGITWTAGSSVKVSGTINNVTTGTMDGTITSINPSTHVLVVSVSGENSGDVFSADGTYKNVGFSNLSVMVYQVKDGSNTFPVGIWMNCYDTANSLSTIRIYGGSDSNPNVMIGNLNGAGLPNINTTAPSGWGLYSQNVFLSGVIVANAGKIGGFTLAAESMYSGKNFPSDSNFYLMPTGSQSTAYNIAGSGNLNNWVMTSGTTFGVTKDGSLFATSGKIGKWQISADRLFYDPNTTQSVGSANSIYLIPASVSTAVSIGGSGNVTNWAITAGSTFGVTRGGSIYSSSGKIGGWDIGTSAIYHTTNSMSSTSKGLYLGTDGIRSYESNTKYVNITGGVITAFGANISGVLKAGANSTIGPWTITDSSIYKTNATWGNATAGAAYFGNNGISITNKFTVSATGELTATSGHVGGWNLDSSSINSTTSTTTPKTNGNTMWIVSDANNHDFIVVTEHSANGDSWPFWVRKDGTMHAERGTIGCWTIDEDSLYNGNALLRYDQIGVTNSDLTKAAYIFPDHLFLGGATSEAPRGRFRLVTDNTSPYIEVAINEGSQSEDISWGFMQDASFWSNGEINANNGMTCRGFDGGRRRVVCTAMTDNVRVGYIAAGASNAFFVCGQFGTTGSTYVTRKVTMTTSDVRLKENIYNTHENGLDLLNNVRLVSFDWKDTHDHKSIGIIADELEQLNPELVAGGGYDEDGNMDVKAIDTLQLLSYTIKAIQEQQAEIESLKKQLASM